MEKLDILTVIRAPLEQYPPSVAQVALMADTGLKVGVVDCYHKDFTPLLFDGAYRVERFRPVIHTQLYKEKSPHLWDRIWRSLVFQRCVTQTIRQRKPKVVIAYDPYAMAAVGAPSKRSKHPKLIWHFHELCTNGKKPTGKLGARAVEFAYKYANLADLVVYSDSGRAETFRREAGLKDNPIVVMNCMRRMEYEPQDHLAARLTELGLQGFRAVYFHGWIGPSRCLETIIESMRWWPNDTVFVAVGPTSDDYRSSLLTVAARLDMAERVVFLGCMPHADVLHLASGAKVGCSLVADEHDPNWIYSAGAINKRFEYMAAGLPQVANRGAGMSDLIENTGCGFLVDPHSPDEVGNAIARILLDAELHNKMHHNSRTIHLSKFNYEQQFAPILNQIIAWRNE